MSYTYLPILYYILFSVLSESILIYIYILSHEKGSFAFFQPSVPVVKNGKIDVYIIISDYGCELKNYMEPGYTHKMCT